MTISKNNDVDYNVEVKSLLYLKHSITPEESLEGLIDEISTIMSRVRNAECTHNEVKKYQENLHDMFYNGKRIISLLNNMKDDFEVNDRTFFSLLKSQFAMLYEENELIDFDAVLDYTLTRVVFEN